jgi:hypothetical protein
MYRGRGGGSPLPSCRRRRYPNREAINNRCVWGFEPAAPQLRRNDRFAGFSEGSARR